MKSFSETQNEFVAHLRDPANHSIEQSIEPRRLKIYTELFFNNIVGFIDSAFPVLKSLYSKSQWLTLIRCFFANHHCRSPYFVDISKEFVEFLSNEYQRTDQDPVFIQELAHYEWLELAISTKHTHQSCAVWDKKAAIRAVYFSELAELACYQFPVHQITKGYQPEAFESAVYIVVYRNDQFDVGFTIVNQVTAHMISLIRENPGRSQQWISQKMCEALPQLPKQQVEAGTLETIQLLLELQVLLLGLD